MKYLKYTWTIIVNLITLGFAIAIFDSASSSSETIILSLLVLIYLSIQTGFIVWGHDTQQTNLALDYEFKRIRKIITEEDLKKEEEPDEAEAIKKLEEAQKKFNKKFGQTFINIIFLGIIYLIAIGNLISAL